MSLDTSHRDLPAQQHTVLPGQTPEGAPILAVLVKRTYDIVPGKRCGRAPADRKLVTGDRHYGDPMNTTVASESDFVPFKLATDVVLNGRAHAPHGGTAQSLVASVAVNSVRKDVLVVGKRICRHRPNRPPAFTEPEPFKAVPLRYELAYGGVDVASDPNMPCIYARNHLGRGFVIGNRPETIEGLRLPNLEDPADPLTPERLITGHFMHWERQPMPQGFGWFAKQWRPRATLAGVMPGDRAFEGKLRRLYARLLSKAQKALYLENPLPAMDFRFFNGASPGLALPFLSGDEVIRLRHLDPEPDLAFQLPGERPMIHLDIGLPKQEHSETVLHTVMIRLEDRQLDMTWRAAFSYPGLDWLPQMRRMEVLVA